MIVLSANNLTKTYGIDEILKGVSFHINVGDRVGIIGNNGAGKTTLLNILAGDTPASSGEFFVSQGRTIGFLRQKDQFDSDRTVFEEVNVLFSHIQNMESEIETISSEISNRSLEGEDVAGLIRRYDMLQEEMIRRDGYRYKSEITGILGSMAFGEDTYNKKIGTLSGGERTRLALACLLLKKPDLLFLDEPTNHLDIGMLKWLEQYLKSYSGTIVLISHDRYFLDQTVNRVFEIENHKLSVYEGSYSSYADQKRERREEELRKYEQQQKEVGRQEEIIRRFKQHGTEKLAKRAISREKRLEQMELMERPDAEVGKMKIHFKQEYKSGNDVLLGEDLSKSFGSGQTKRKLFEGVSFDIKRGEKICIVGANGIGKTTLLKMMMGAIDSNMGYLKVGHNVLFGYYDQNQQLLTESNTVLEELKESYRLYSDTEMRSILGRFLFKNDKVFLDIRALSGGEKARLTLVKLMLSGANVLILDEPTNHLDIASKEVFEDALKEFPGTVIAVSHDRYFLNKIPDRIFELEADGITTYLGSYNYYAEKKQAITSGKKYIEELDSKPNNTKGDDPGDSISGNELRRQSKAKETALRRTERLKNSLESEIHKTETKIEELEQEMCNEENLSDHIKLAQYSKEVDGLKEYLSQKYEEWLELHEDDQGE